MSDGRGRSYRIYLASGQEDQAKHLACHVVEPDINANFWVPTGTFLIYSSTGVLLITEDTYCP